MGLYIFSALIGICNMVLWGIYADLLVEAFAINKVLRSVLLGVFAGIYLYTLNPHLPFIIVALTAISLERLITEVYKNLIRIEPQEKYLVPSALNWPIPTTVKKIVGVLVIALGLIAFKYIRVQLAFWVVYAVAIIPAITGALKDAPHEGFSLIKFFRLPVIVGIVGIVLNDYFPTLESKYLLFAMGGGERVLSECYKKVIKGNIPGKFKVDSSFKPNVVWLKKRKYILIPYIASLLLILYLIFRSISR